MSAIFSLHDVHHLYPDGMAGLKGCTLAVRQGSRNAILGANGSGKTTLLQHLNGLLRPSAGSVCFEGSALDYSRKGLQSLRRRVGFVFQNPDRQLFSADVQEDVSFGPLNLGLDEATVRQRVDEALAAVGMQGQARQPVHQLSFGQKKRVCIAGVLAMQPDALLLDEPMAGLDAEMQSELTRLLDGLSARGITVVLSSHDVDFAYRWADDLHLMAAGRCVASFAAAELPAHAGDLRTAGQPLPSAIALHQLLAQRGVLPAQPAPRSLDALLSTLRAQGATPSFSASERPTGVPIE